jgi:glucan phosphoethanolaminetransferase (alkaline phosphatase superfamily)
MGMVLAYYIWGELVPDQNRVVSFSAFSMEVIDTNGTLNDKTDDTVVDSQSTWYIGALAILSALTALFSVFQFKNRLTQMKLGALNALFMVAVLGISYFHITQFEKLFPEAAGGPQLGFYLPVAAMLLNMIANRFIRKDEKLVKSVDRIR